ncbi:MAG TPA: transcriptional repressor, partial [Syntrophales bacterium]
MMTKDAIIQKLKESGLRVTPQRLAIIEVLLEKGHLHPGAGLIYKEERKKSRSLSLSTTYATINEFARRGVIKTLQFDGVE